MKIETKFDINDRVYYISQAKEKEWIICKACNGVGTVMLKDEKVRSCPECYGQKGGYIYKELKWQINSQLTIGQIRVKIINLKQSDIFSNIGYYKEGLDKQETEYMCYETGIRSGNIYNEKDMFHTKNRAQTECDERNKTEIKNI